MANKKISELVSRTPSLTDLMLVGDPSSGYSYKCTITELSTLLEANITLNDLNDVVITAPTNGQVLTYNGTNWVNGNNGITEINGLTAASQSFSVGTSGTDFAIVSSISTHTFNLPTASATNRGALSSADWSTFNSKIGGSGTTNYISKFTGTSTIGNSLLFDNGTSVGINTATPSVTYLLDVNGSIRATMGNFNTVAQVGKDDNTSLYPYLSLRYASGSGADIQGFEGGSGSVKIRMASTSLYINTPGNMLFCNAINETNESMRIVGGTKNVLIGTQTDDGQKLQVNGNVKISTIANATTDTDRFLVSDSGIIKYRTGAELLSDIGGAAASSISGTTNYIPKFTGTSAIGNSSIIENTFSIVSSKDIGVKDTGSSSNFNVSNYSVGAQLGAFDGGGYGRVGTYTNHDFIFMTNIAERMRLTASGNLGLGTSNPAYKLDVNGDASSYSVFVNGGSGTGGALRIKQYSSSEANLDGYNTISTLNTGVFYFTAATTSPNFKSFVIDPSGLTENTLRTFTLPNASGTIALTSNITSAISGTTNYIPKFTSSSAIGNSAIYDNSGNIGINTISAAYKLQVAGGSSTNNNTANVIVVDGAEHSRLKINTSTAGGYQASLILSSGEALSATTNEVSISTAGSKEMRFSTAGSVRMRLDASGNLGLGVTPSAWGAGIKAQQIGATSGIYNISGETSITENVFIDASYNPIYLTSNSSTIYRQTAGQHRWFTAPSGTAGNAISFTQAMTLDASGRLGIGTTNPAELLEVSGSSNIYAKITSSNGANAGVKLNSVGVREFGIFSDGSLRFYDFTASTERMRITSGGNVGINTQTPAALLDVNGTAKAAQFNSTTGTISVPVSTNTTFFTPSSVGLYMAHVYLTGNATQTWDAVIIFAFNATNILVVNQTNSANVSTVVSGTSIQVRQIGATTFTFNYEIIKIA